MGVESLGHGAIVLLLLILFVELAILLDLKGWPVESEFASRIIGLIMILLIVLIVFAFLRIQIFLIQIFIIGFLLILHTLLQIM